MERITPHLSGRSLNDSVLHQTPFEKSLRRRLHKVGSVLELIETENEYTPASALSSADELRRLIDAYEVLDGELARVITQYIDVSLVRKRLFKGEEAADKMAVLLGVEEAWLQAAFAEIDARWGGFDNYVREGLGLTEADIAQLKANLLSGTPSARVSRTGPIS